MLIVFRSYQNKHFMATSDHKDGEHYFRMLTELNEYGFQCSVLSYL